VLREAIWRLRHRLLLTYLFIAVVPIVLVAGLFSLAANYLVSQIAIYLVTAELDKRVDGLSVAGDSIAMLDDAPRPAGMKQIMDQVFGDRYPGVEVVLRQSGREIHYPEEVSPPAPLKGWEATKGILVRDSRLYLWC